MDGDLAVLEPTPLAAAGTELDGQAALWADPAQLLNLPDDEFRQFTTDVVRTAGPLIAQVRQAAGMMAWAGWHRFEDRPYREFIEGLAAGLGTSKKSVERWRDKVVKEARLPRPTRADLRAGEATNRGKPAGQRPDVDTLSTVIPASSAEAAEIPGEHAPAGSGRPAGAGSPGHSSEGGGRVGETRTAPPVIPPSDQLLEGVRSNGAPAPSGPTERLPSDRQLVHRVIAAMREVDPADAGPRLTPEEATFLRQWAQRTLDAWRGTTVPASPPEPPARRSGYVIRPEDRQAAAALASAQAQARQRPNGMAAVRASLAGEVAMVRPADCGHPVGQRLGDTCMACGKAL